MWAEKLEETTKDSQQHRNSWALKVSGGEVTLINSSSKTIQSSNSLWGVKKHLRSSSSFDSTKMSEGTLQGQGLWCIRDCKSRVCIHTLLSVDSCISGISNADSGTKLEQMCDRFIASFPIEQVRNTEFTCQNHPAVPMGVVVNESEITICYTLCLVQRQTR